MRIIMVSGAKNTGKTTTIAGDFYTWIKANGKTPQITKSGKDIEGIFTYKGKTIAVHSMGDRYQEVVYAIVKYAHCDSLVMAGTTSVNSILNLIGKINLTKHHCVIQKQAPTNADNQSACKKIIAAI